MIHLHTHQKSLHVCVFGGNHSALQKKKTYLSCITCGRYVYNPHEPSKDIKLIFV